MEGRKLICQNDLIDNFKKYKPIELKVFYNMLYCYKEQVNYNPDLTDEEETYMEIDKLNGYLGKKHLSDAEIRNIILNIPKGVYSKDKKGYISAFELIKYDEEYEEFVFKLTDTFKPLVDDVIKKFTVLELKYMANLSSSYSLRMFEFISKNKNLKEYKMPIEEFKRYFEIPKSYQMCVIEKRILKYCENDINSNTNLKVKIEKVKKQNKVTHILFKF